MKIHELIETLDRSYTELKERNTMPEVGEVQKLFQKAEILEQQVEQKILNTTPCFRPISRFYQKMFGELSKIEKVEQKISEFLEVAQKHQEQQVINKKLWELQRKGLIGHHDIESTEPLFRSYIPQMKAVNCSHVFVLFVVSKEEGILELVVFGTENERLVNYSIDIKKAFEIEEKSFDTIEELLAVYAPYGLPLNQLQDVASWLDVHATGERKISHIFSTSAIEQKLSDILKSYPQGAYILHPGDDPRENSLKLSRIYQKGKIHHLTVDLTEQLGYYTISDEQGRLACQTRVQFKRSLEQMGIPLRLKVVETDY